MSEKAVLKKLGISDFRHMTKEKVVKFASMLPYMDPEVAKKALEQFPAFKDLAGELVVQYKLIVDKVFEENQISQQAFYDACNSIITSLQKELEKEDISAEERDRIENKMIQVAAMIGEKNSENKGLILKILAVASGVIVAIGGFAAAILGSNTQISQNTLDDNETPDENDDYEDIVIE